MRGIPAHGSALAGELHATPHATSRVTAPSSEPPAVPPLLQRTQRLRMAMLAMPEPCQSVPAERGISLCDVAGKEEPGPATSPELTTPRRQLRRASTSPRDRPSR